MSKKLIDELLPLLFLLLLVGALFFSLVYATKQQEQINSDQRYKEVCVARVNELQTYLDVCKEQTLHCARGERDAYVEKE